MRVIAGTLRSRRLHAPTGNQTRPTHDRVKEALFSVLGNLSDTRVLDLYAGTGALGIEALSRGASHAVFVEQSRVALECIRRNLRELNLLESSTIVGRSVESSVATLCRSGPYDLVFCDPPWANIESVIATLDGASLPTWLGEQSLLLLEHPTKFCPPDTAFSGMTVEGRRSWGDTAVTFFRAAPPGERPGEASAGSSRT